MGRKVVAGKAGLFGVVALCGCKLCSRRPNRGRAKGGEPNSRPRSWPTNFQSRRRRFSRPSPYGSTCRRFAKGGAAGIALPGGRTIAIGRRPSDPASCQGWVTDPNSSRGPAIGAPAGKAPARSQVLSAIRLVIVDVSSRKTAKRLSRAVCASKLPFKSR